MAERRGAVTLIVNGRKKEIQSRALSPEGDISFDDVVRLAFANPPSGQFIMFTVTYRNGAGRQPKGRLSEGQRVKVQNGTIFNVSYTDKS